MQYLRRKVAGKRVMWTPDDEQLRLRLLKQTDRWIEQIEELMKAIDKLIEIEQEGYDACWNGVKCGENPYSHEDDKYNAWDQGWFKAQREDDTPDEA